MLLMKDALTFATLVVHQLRKIYRSKRPGYGLLILMNSSGCTIAQQLPPQDALTFAFSKTAHRRLGWHFAMGAALQNPIIKRLKYTVSAIYPAH